MKDLLDELSVMNFERNSLLDPENKLSALFFATELGGEVGELLNIVKKLERVKLLPNKGFSIASLESLDDEAADVIICVSLLMNKYGRNLRPAIIKKFNATSDKLNMPIRLEVKL